MPMLSIPQSMEDEIKKSVYILKEFTADSDRGPDKLIPDSIFAKAKGVAIISYAKMGCFVSARGGSGIVVAKLPSGGWSAPSAVGIIGLSGGLEFGIEMTAIIMMLMYSNAVKAFMKGKNVTLGGGISVAAGPLGRDLEADVAIKSPAAMYTYAKAKGLFVGINLGGTLVLERRKANEKCYGPGVRAYGILSGKVDIPPQCRVLHDVLTEQGRQAKRKGLKQAVNIGSKAAEKKYGIKGLNKFANTNTDKALVAEEKYHHRGSTSRDNPSSSSHKSSSSFHKSSSSSHSLHFKGKSKFLGNKKTSKSKPSVKTHSSKGPPRAAPSRPTTTKKGPAPHPTKRAAPAPPPPVQRTYSSQSSPGVPPPHSGVPPPHSGVPPPHSGAPQRTWGEAIYPFTGDMSCDISFQKNDRIEILTKTPFEFDWWEGRFNGKVGIFPANYVKVVA